MRRLVICSIVACCAAGCLSPAPAQSEGPADSIRLQTSVKADSVTVGERFRVVYTASFPDSLVLLPPEKFDAGTCRIIAVDWRQELADRREVKVAELTVLTVDLESASLPALPFLFLTPRGDTLTAWSDEIDVPVRHLAGAEAEPKPLKPQWSAPRSYRYLYFAGALLALAALLFWLWKRRKPREVFEPPAPELPADFVALQALERIEAMNLLEAGEFKQFYTLVVDTARHYLERRFDIQAMDRTTHEILWDLEAKGKIIEGLAPLLEEADLVKFAKYIPDIDSGRRSLEAARDIIIRTRQRPAATAELVAEG